MAAVDAKSNFMLLMSLMGLTPRIMAPALGTDVTLISRWRTGKRRMIDGRPWVDKVADYFVSQDGVYDEPCLQKIMQALYPAKRCDTPEEMKACVLQFLLCPGQGEYAYRLRRYELLCDVLPGRLAAPHNPKDEVDHIGVWTRGKQKLMAAVMEYFGEVAKSQSARRMILVAPEGLNVLLRIDEVFGSKLLERLTALFEAGHQLTLIVHPRYAPEGSGAHLARLEAMHLRGYIDTHYCDEFLKKGAFMQTLILTSKTGLCVSATLPGGDASKAHVLTVRSPVTASKTHFMALKLRNRYPEHHQHELFRNPSGFFERVEWRGDEMRGPMYYLTDIPFFCALDREGVRDAYQLTREEYENFLKRDYQLLTLRPQDVHGAPVRWVLCVDEIERALVTDEVEAPEMSAILDREVRLDRRGVLKLLKGMLVAMDRAEAFEVALLPRHVMDRLGLRAYIMEGAVALGSGQEGYSTGTWEPQNVAWAAEYGHMIWKRVPPGMKNMAVVRKAIEDLVATYEYAQPEPAAET